MTIDQDKKSQNYPLKWANDFNEPADLSKSTWNTLTKTGY